MTDLNAPIPASLGITLAFASDINSSDWTSTHTGGYAIDFSLTCRPLRNYLLTPGP